MAAVPTLDSSHDTASAALALVQVKLDMASEMLALERAAFARERALLEDQVRLARNPPAPSSQHAGRRPGHIGVFWDIENCSVSLQTNASRLVKTLRSYLEPHGPIAFIRIYVDVGEQSSYAAGLRSGLAANGVEIRDCGRWGRKDVADHHIMADIALFAMDNPPPATICLISGDKDFSYLLSSMRNRGYDVLLFENQMGAAEALKASANKGVHKFRDLVKEAGTTVDPTGSSVNPPQAAPLGSAVANGLPAATAAHAVPSAEHRLRTNTEPLPPSLLAAATSSASLFTSAKPQKPMTGPDTGTNAFTLGSKTKVPLPSSSIFPSGPVASSAAQPAAMRKAPNRYENLVTVLRGMPKSRPLRSYIVPFLSRESWGQGVSSKEFFQDAIDAGVITAGKGEQLGMEWISLSPAYRSKNPGAPTSPVKALPPKLPAVSSPTKALAKPAPVPVPAPPAAPLVSAVYEEVKKPAPANAPIVVKSASATVSRQPSTAGSLRADTPTVGASSSAATNGSKSNLYAALQEETAQDEAPPSSLTTALPSSPAVRQLKADASAPSQANTSSPARKHALAKAIDNSSDPLAALKLFQPLIQLLSTLPARPAPLRFVVSQLLRATHPKIYEAYGWKSYAARAEDEGIVDLGDSPARTGKGRKEWILLRDRYRESKHEMIVVEAGDTKVPLYNEKTAELFEPLIKALRKLPPASTANKTPATYVKTMSGQLASAGTAFLEDVGVNCMADYFTLAKRMGVIRMGMGKTNDPASEWLALKRDYQRAPTPSRAGTPESQASKASTDVPVKTPMPAATPAPATAAAEPAPAPTAAATPAKADAFNDFSFSFGSPAAASATPKNGAQRALTPLSQSTIAASPSKPAAVTTAQKADLGSAAAAAQATAPTPAPATTTKQQQQAPEQPVPKPAAPAAPSPAPAPAPAVSNAPDGSLFRSLEQQLDLSLKLSDSDSE